MRLTVRSIVNGNPSGTPGDQSSTIEPSAARSSGGGWPADAYVMSDELRSMTATLATI
jgi:hypothetical protein